MADAAPRAIKFIRAQIDALTGEQCQATVTIENPHAGEFTATAQGGASQADQLRAVARAAADALSEAFNADGASVRVRSVQVVETPGQSVIVVSVVASMGAQTQSLVGVCQGGDDSVRATALAVLNATNRFLARQ